MKSLESVFKNQMPEIRHMYPIPLKRRWMVRATGYPKFPLLPCLPSGRASMPSWDRQPCLYIENTSSEHVVCPMMIYSSPALSINGFRSIDCNQYNQ